MKNAIVWAAISMLAGAVFAPAQSINWNNDPVGQVSVAKLKLLAANSPAPNPTSSAAPNPPAVPPLSQDVGGVDLTNSHLNAMLHNAIAEVSKQASYEPDGTVYVKTGDISAEWLRDSSAELRPYLFFAKGNTDVDNFLKAAIVREFRYIAVDPYANAFNENYSVHEEKFELDSLLYPISLAWTYWKVTGDAAVFSPDVVKGLKIALTTMQNEQNHSSSPRQYSYNGLGTKPVAWTGMIWTGFRPSDDACIYNYLIPSEMMAVVTLEELADIEGSALGDLQTAQEARSLGAQVQSGIEAKGIVDSNVPGIGKIYAYEVDGYGNHMLMDDGNIPSLLSAPYLGYVSANDPVYKATQKFLLSPHNPYFYKGSFEQGIGSPHTPKGYVWPLALLSQALTSTGAQRQNALSMLSASDPGDGLLHESFNPNSPQHYTRADFAWPNALFAEFLLETQGGKAPLPMPPQPAP